MDEKNVPWLIVVFSFNRGKFLNNCLESIKKCASNIETIVIDDGSTDKETIAALDKHQSEQQFSFVFPDSHAGSARLGGLYSNMQYAMELARQNGKKFVIFIQDDMQFVRAIEPEDLKMVESHFQIANVGQVNSNFLRRLGTEYYKENLKWNEEKNFYQAKQVNIHKANYSDVGIFPVDKFLDTFGSFKHSEIENDRKALSLNQIRVTMANPFMMWLPFSKSYYRKNSPFKTKAIEFLANCGYYPYSFMSDSEVAILKARDKDKVLPIAEEYLSATGLSNRGTWAFSAGVINLFARGGLYRIIAKIIWKL